MVRCGSNLPWRAPYAGTSVPGTLRMALSPMPSLPPGTPQRASGATRWQCRRPAGQRVRPGLTAGTLGTGASVRLRPGRSIGVGAPGHHRQECLVRESTAQAPCVPRPRIRLTPRRRRARCRGHSRREGPCTVPGQARVNPGADAGGAGRVGLSRGPSTWPRPRGTARGPVQSAELRRRWFRHADLVHDPSPCWPRHGAIGSRRGDQHRRVEGAADRSSERRRVERLLKQRGLRRSIGRETEVLAGKARREEHP